MLRAQGWEHLFEEQVSASEEEVQQFYGEFNFVKNSRSGALSGTAEIDGELISFTPKTIAAMLGIPSAGFSFEALEKLTQEQQQLRDASSRRLFKRVITSVPTSELTRIQRIAHHVIIKAVVPRQEKRNSITSMDLVLLDRFLHMEPIDLPKTMLLHMGKCTSDLMIQKKHALPYTKLVKLLLQKFGVYRAANEVPLVWEMNALDIRKLKCKDDMEMIEGPSAAPREEKGEGSKGGTAQHQMLHELKQISNGIGLLVSGMEQLNTTMKLLLDHQLSTTESVDPDLE